MKTVLTMISMIGGTVSLVYGVVAQDAVAIGVGSYILLLVSCFF